MAWTSPKTYAVGDVLTAADMNTYQRDNFLALGEPSWAYAKWSIAMINDTAYRSYTGTRISADEQGGYTISDVGSKITVPEDGTYLIVASLWSPNANGGAGAIFASNSAGTFLAGQRASLTAGSDSLDPVGTCCAVAVAAIDADDYVQLGGYSNVGADHWELSLVRLSPN